MDGLNSIIGAAFDSGAVVPAATAAVVTVVASVWFLTARKPPTRGYIDSIELVDISDEEDIHDRNETTSKNTQHSKKSKKNRNKNKRKNKNNNTSNGQDPSEKTLGADMTSPDRESGSPTNQSKGLKIETHEGEAGSTGELSRTSGDKDDENVFSPMLEKVPVFKNLRKTPKSNEYPMGIMNKGNTCFMNSVLQGLSSLDTLLCFLEDHEKTRYRIELAKRKARIEEARMLRQREKEGLMDDVVDSETIQRKESSSESLYQSMSSLDKRPSIDDGELMARTRLQTRKMYEEDAHKHAEEKNMGFGSRLLRFFSRAVLSALRRQPPQKLSMCSALSTMIDEINSPGTLGRATRADIIFNALRFADGGDRLTRYEQEDAHELYTVISSSLTDEELVVPEFDEGKNMFELMRSISVANELSSTENLSTTSSNFSIKRTSLNARMVTDEVSVASNGTTVGEQDGQVPVGPLESRTSEVTPIRSSVGIYPRRIGSVPLIIRNPMSGLVSTLLTCCFCGYTPPITLNRFDHLSLTLPLSRTYRSHGGVTVEYLIKEYMESEIVEGWKCPGCWRTRFLDKIEFMISNVEESITSWKAQGYDNASTANESTSSSPVHKSKKKKKSAGSSAKATKSPTANKSVKQGTKLDTNVTSYDSKLNELENKLKELKLLLEVGQQKYPGDIESNEEDYEFKEKLFKIQPAVVQRVKKQAGIAQYPKCLVLHLQRTTYLSNRPVKNKTHVVLHKYLYPPEHGLSGNDGESLINSQLNESQFLVLNSMAGAGIGESKSSEPEDNGESQSPSGIVKQKLGTCYKLKAVIFHHGDHGYGHYVCCREWGPSEEWLFISDSSVNKVKGGFDTVAQGLMGGDAYMLFYELA